MQIRGILSHTIQKEVSAAEVAHFDLLKRSEVIVLRLHSMTSGEIRCPVNTCKQVVSGGVDCLSTFAEGRELRQIEPKTYKETCPKKIG